MSRIGFVLCLCLCVLMLCVVIYTFKTKITKVPVRVLVMDVPISDAYSLESVSKHGFCKWWWLSPLSTHTLMYAQMTRIMTCVSVAIEVGPQPHGVVRADIYLIMKEAVDLTIDWIHKFNSGTVRPNVAYLCIFCYTIVVRVLFCFQEQYLKAGIWKPSSLSKVLIIPEIPRLGISPLPFILSYRCI